MANSCGLTTPPYGVAKGRYRCLPSVMKSSFLRKMHCRILSPDMEIYPQTKCVLSPQSQMAHENRHKNLSSSPVLGEQLDHKKLETARSEIKRSKLSRVRTLLIDNYDSYTYNIFQLLAVVNGVPPTVVKNDQLTWEYLCHLLYEKHAFDNIVISPGPGSPSRDTDIGICMKILHECNDIPILGVCLGHQALGYAHGAMVVHAPQPVHGRLSNIEHNGSELFTDIPSGSGSGFNVVRYHSLVLDPNTLPDELIPIAWTSSSDMISPCHQLNTHEMLQPANVEHLQSSKNEKNSYKVNERPIVMGVMHAKRPHYGLQFHPESIATAYGRKILENFRSLTYKYWMESCRLQKKFPLNRRFNGQETMLTIDTSPRKVLKRGNTSNRPSKSNDSCKKEPTLLELHWKQLSGIAQMAGGPNQIFRSLFGDDLAKNTFWLDSSCVDNGRARFSFMGSKGGSLWRCISFRLNGKSSSENGPVGGFLSIEDEAGNVHKEFLDTGFFEYFEKELQSFTFSKENSESLPFDFCGGYVGYIGYELKSECGMQHNRHKSNLPDACFFLTDRLLVIDHLTNDVFILSLFPILDSNVKGAQKNQKGRAPSVLDCNAPQENSQNKNSINGTSIDVLSGDYDNNHCNRIDSEKWVEATEKKLLLLAKTVEMPKEQKKMLSSRIENFNCQPEDFKLQKSRDQYLDDVRKCIHHIINGESYELCFTSQFSKIISIVDKFNLYLTLRERNPAPYAAWLSFGREDICICSSSPERFLRLDKDGVLEAKPIKGTMPRGNSKIEDEKLLLKLKNSEKDQAENLMIVDLLRNDLGRVCEPGTVHVPSLMDVESYATVHTMVSTVRGRKKIDISPLQCVKAAFPGGSMTGAPKLRSMEILDSLENTSRGVYSGAIGFFSFNKTFDLNIVIRTIVINGNEVSIGAGGAVVYLSDPEEEYNEMMLKAKAPISVVAENENQQNLKK